MTSSFKKGDATTLRKWYLIAQRICFQFLCRLTRWFLHKKQNRLREPKGIRSYIGTSLPFFNQPWRAKQFMSWTLGDDTWKKMGGVRWNFKFPCGDNMCCPLVYKTPSWTPNPGQRICSHISIWFLSWLPWKKIPILSHQICSYGMPYISSGWKDDFFRILRLYLSLYFDPKPKCVLPQS